MLANWKKRYQTHGTLTATVGYKGRVSGSQPGVWRAGKLMSNPF